MLPTLRNGLSVPLDTLHREFDRAFGLVSDGVAAMRSFPVDITENGNDLVIEAELPGYKKDEIEVTTEDGVLTIIAERSQEETKDDEAKAGKRRLTERSYSKVSRSFRFPATVDINKVDATLEDGVLKLTLPKREEVKPRKIQVK